MNDSKEKKEKKSNPKIMNSLWLVGWLVGIYGISTFIGYLMPNPFLWK